MDQTRRAALTGMTAAAAVGASLPARAAPLPRIIERHPGFKAWKQMFDPGQMPMNEKVILLDGQEAPLWAWLGRGPTVLVFWATWCAPCIAEKPAQSYLERRLKYLHSATHIKCIQAYDSNSLQQARAKLDQVRATELETVRASPGLEKAMAEYFGPSDVDSKRPVLPSLVLLGPGGVELGRAKGAMHSPSGQSYWGDAVTMQFLAGLDKMLLET